MVSRNTSEALIAFMDVLDARAKFLNAQQWFDEIVCSVPDIEREFFRREITRKENEAGL